VRVVAAAWLRGSRVLAAQHGPGSSRAGEWEFPGGKVEPGESDAEALVRELVEELGAEVRVREPAIGRHTFVIGRRTIDLWLYEVRSEAEPIALEHGALAWIDAEGGETLGWSTGDAALWPAVRERLGPRD